MVNSHSFAKGLDIIIPVYNEIKISCLFELFDKNVKTNFKVIICYDFDDDKTLVSYNPTDYSFKIIKIKNKGTGPNSAIISGLIYSNAEAIIFYTADDLLNTEVIDKMYSYFIYGNDVVVGSRFMKGGEMKNPPLIKGFLAKCASLSLYYLSSIPVKDSTNLLKLFSKKYLNSILIESNKGFAFSMELLVKAKRLRLKIAELPVRWEERAYGSSRFRISKWITEYLRWYLYAMATFWLKKGTNKVATKLK